MIKSGRPWLSADDGHLPVVRRGAGGARPASLGPPASCLAPSGQSVASGNGPFKVDSSTCLFNKVSCWVGPKGRDDSLDFAHSDRHVVGLPHPWLGRGRERGMLIDRRVLSGGRAAVLGRAAVIAAGVALLASCSSAPGTKFSEAEYGVKASPKVASGKRIPKGGGQAMVGKPYRVAGKTYVPRDDPSYSKTGLASWYGPNFHGSEEHTSESV